MRWRERGGKQEYLTASFLTGAPVSCTFRHLSSPNGLRRFPMGPLDTECQVLLSYPAPTHKWHGHGYLFFSWGAVFCGNYCFLGREHLNSPVYLFSVFTFFFFFFLKDYRLQHKETTRLCPWLTKYFLGWNVTEFFVFTTIREVGSVQPHSQQILYLILFSLWRASRARRVLKTLLHLKYMGFSSPQGNSGQVYVALRKPDVKH